MKLSFVVFLLLCVSVAGAQSLTTVKDLSNKHQVCLDSGIDMQGCSLLFCMQMDTLLNEAYNNLHKTLTAPQKKALKDEQLKWLNKRDAYFDKEAKDFQEKYKSGEWGTDMFMVVYDDDAEFIKARVETLIKRRNK